jgi:RHS repeat-associated protein
MSSGTRVDLLTARYLDSTVCGGQPCAPYLSLTQRYDNDANGRVVRISSYKHRASPLSSPFHVMELDASLNGGNAAEGAVYRQVSDSDGRVFEYFYDAVGRRRLKRYGPSAAQGTLQDEYFYDGVHLLEDWGNTELDSATTDSVRDEYIWLAGRPVAFFKSRVSRNQQRIEDFVGDCPRNGEPAPCGLYFVVTDWLAKPVVILDSSRRVAGVADYDPFGHVNQVVLAGESAVALPGQEAMLATAQVPYSPSLVTQMRVRYSLLDVHEGSSVYLTGVDGTLLTGVDGQSTVISDRTEWKPVSNWVDAPGGTIQIRFQASSLVTAMQDALLSRAEYRRFQLGASPVWTPLRFPGQYFDQETGLFENWNRFYDPEMGRYLGPDPVMLDPKAVPAEMGKGFAPYVYAYARNNPVSHVDPMGLAPTAGDIEQTPEELARQKKLRIENAKKVGLKETQKLGLKGARNMAEFRQTAKHEKANEAQATVRVLSDFTGEKPKTDVQLTAVSQTACGSGVCAISTSAVVIAVIHDHFGEPISTGQYFSRDDLAAAQQGRFIFLYTHNSDRKEGDLLMLNPEGTVYKWTGDFKNPNDEGTWGLAAPPLNQIK